MSVQTTRPGFMPGRSGGSLSCPQESTAPTARNQILWTHQQAARTAIHSAIRNGRQSGLIQMPCGTGKTTLFVTVARDLDFSTLCIVHTDELINQSVDAFAETWPSASIGVLKAERNEWQNGEKVVIASVQSLRNGRLAEIPRDRFGFLVIDECHHSPAKTWTAIINHFDDRKFMCGVSATPFRLDGEGLDSLFGGEPLFSYPLRSAIKDKILVRLRQFGIETLTSLDNVSTFAGDFVVGELSEATNTYRRNKIIVDAYEKHCADRRAVVFATDVTHAKALEGLFNKLGVRATSVDGSMNINERRKILAAFKRGEFRVMCNCKILSEGFNDCGVSAILMARPTKSRAFYIQAVGRALRRCDEEGKKDAIVLDFQDNARRHKFCSVLDLFGDVTEKNAAGEDVIEFVDREIVQRERRREIASQSPLSWKIKGVSPWPETPDLRGYTHSQDWQTQQASDKQINFIRSFGLQVDRKLTKGECSYLIERSLEFRATYPQPPSLKQKKFLQWKKLWCADLTFTEASRLIGEVKRSESKSNGKPKPTRAWKKRGNE